MIAVVYPPPREVAEVNSLLGPVALQPVHPDGPSTLTKPGIVANIDCSIKVKHPGEQSDKHFCTLYIVHVYTYMYIWYISTFPSLECFQFKGALHTTCFIVFPSYSGFQ